MASPLIHHLSDISAWQWALLSVLVLVIYSIALAIYRLYLSPLASFPGPKLAAATQWYEFYFDVLQGPGGQFYKEISRLHDEYGPIVRINPHELHIRDVGFLETFFPPLSVKRDKYPPAAKTFGQEFSIHGTIDHDTHRMRRHAIAKLYTKRGVASVRPMISELLEVIGKLLEEKYRTGDWVDMETLFLAFITDTTYQHFFDSDSGYLRDLEKATAWRQSVMLTTSVAMLTKQVPWVVPIMLGAPKTVQNAMIWLQPGMRAMFEHHRLVGQIVDKHLRSKTTETSMDEKSLGRPKSILHAIEQSDLPPHEKSRERMRHESLIALLAGSGTTSSVMSMFMYQLAIHPDIRAKIRQEVIEAAGDSDKLPDYSVLEKLPWLHATIREGLRIKCFLFTRNSLVAHEGLAYGKWFIPPRTPLSISQIDYLWNAEIYPDPFDFKPQRWFDPTEDQTRAFIPFSKGARKCIGVEFANEHMFAITALIAARFDFEPYETTWERDVLSSRDCFMGAPDPSSKGTRFIITGDNGRFAPKSHASP